MENGWYVASCVSWNDRTKPEPPSSNEIVVGKEAIPNRDGSTNKQNIMRKTAGKGERCRRCMDTWSERGGDVNDEKPKDSAGVSARIENSAASVCVCVCERHEKGVTLDARRSGQEDGMRPKETTHPPVRPSVDAEERIACSISNLEVEDRR